MTKLITTILILMFTSSAFASGFKANAGLENYEMIKQSNSMCSTTWGCSGNIEKQRGQALKVGLGYEIDITERYTADMNVGINSMTNGSAELNAGYKINDKVKAKVGVNMSKDLNAKIIQNVKPGVGVQVGAEYKLNDKMNLFGTVGTKSQSYEIQNVPGSFNNTSVAGQVGISFSF